MRQVSPRERKLLAVGLLVLALVLGESLIVAPVIDGFQSRAAERERLKDEYAHNQRVIASIDRLRREAVRQRAALAPFVMKAHDNQEGLDRLRERAQRLVEARGGEFRGAEDASAPAGWLGTRVVARLSLEQLVALLAEVQNHPPYLVVTALNIDAKEPIAGAPPPPLEVSFEIIVPVSLA